MEELINELRKVDLDIPSILWHFIWEETDFRTNKTLKVARYVEYIDEYKGKLLKRVFAFKSRAKECNFNDIQIVEVMRKLEGQSGCLLASIWHNMSGKHVEFDRMRQDRYFWTNKTDYTFSNCYKMYDESDIIIEYGLDYCQWFNVKNHSLMEFFDYICAYRQEPKIELLVKANLSQFVHCYKKLNLKGKSLDQIFRVNNYWVPYLTQLYYSDIMNIRNKKRRIKTIDDLMDVRSLLMGLSRDYSKIKKYACPKMRKYLNNENYRYWSMYNDYLRFCEELGYDLDDYSILCPKDMKKEHDRAMKLIVIKKDEQTKAKFFDAYRNLLEYVYSENNLVIIPCEHLEELELESAELDHCVRTYANRYANKETNIMFIRSVNEIEKPLYTLEFNNKKIIQCRAKHNERPDDLGIEFVRHWADLHGLECRL